MRKIERVLNISEKPLHGIVGWDEVLKLEEDRAADEWARMMHEEDRYYCDDLKRKFMCVKNIKFFEWQGDVLLEVYAEIAYMGKDSSIYDGCYFLFINKVFMITEFDRIKMEDRFDGTEEDFYHGLPVKKDRMIVRPIGFGDAVEVN